MKTSHLIPAFLLVAPIVSAIDFQTQVAPIFRQKCYECHSIAKDKVKGKVALDTPEEISKHIGPGQHIIPGQPAKSSMVIVCALPDDDEDVMPPKGKNRLTDAEVNLLKQWVQEGALLTKGGAPAPTSPAASPASSPALKWTNTAGVTIEAEFQALEGESVRLKVVSTGISHLVPLSSLSPESQAQAKAQPAKP